MAGEHILLVEDHPDVARTAMQQGLPIIMISGEPGRIARYSGGTTPFLGKTLSTPLISCV